VDQRWAWPLRMVAIYGWMLSQIRPSDFEAFLSYAPRIVGQGGCLNRRALLHLCADAFLQCPKAIHTWASMVADDGLPGVSAGNPESTATGYARMSVKVANQCDLAIHCNKASCEQMQAEQEQVPRRVVTEVGMISEAPPCKRQKQGQNDTGESAAGDLARKAGMVVVDNVVWKELLLLAANLRCHACRRVAPATDVGGSPQICFGSRGLLERLPSTLRLWPY